MQQYHSANLTKLLDLAKTACSVFVNIVRPRHLCQTGTGGNLGLSLNNPSHAPLSEKPLPQVTLHTTTHTGGIPILLGTKTIIQNKAMPGDPLFVDVSSSPTGLFQKIRTSMLFAPLSSLALMTLSGKTLEGTELEVYGVLDEHANMVKHLGELGRQEYPEKYIAKRWKAFPRGDMILRDWTDRIRLKDSCDFGSCEACGLYPNGADIDDDAAAALDVGVGSNGDDGDDDDVIATDEDAAYHGDAYGYGYDGNGLGYYDSDGLYHENDYSDYGSMAWYMREYGDIYD